ncbi:MAG: sulfotransferase [Pseudolabrys sp.]
MSYGPIKKPNFFLLGAAKSGTSTLYHCLKQHPEIFMSTVKEPTFFNEGYQQVTDPISYFALFEGATTEKVLGEASHVYMSNPRVSPVLRGLFPDARFLVVLRNPAERAFSLYHHMRRHGHEYIGSFEAALAAEDRRYASARFRERCPQYFYNFMYFRSGEYGHQLQRYFEYFPKEQFHIIRMDAMINNYEDTVRKIFQFLAIADDFIPELKHKNAGDQTARFASMQYFATHKLGRTVIIRKAVRSLLKRINLMPLPAMNPDTRGVLMERFASDQQLLRELAGISFIS